MDSVAVFSLTPLSVKISNYSSAELYFEWVKPLNASVFSFVSVELGIMIAVLENSTQVLELKSGNLIKSLPAKITSGQIGELDNFLYFGDSTSNQYQLLRIKAPEEELKSVKNCTKFCYGIARCVLCEGNKLPDSLGKCTPLHFLNDSTLIEGPNGNNMPGINLKDLDFQGYLLNPEFYNLELASDDSFKTQVEFKHLQNLSQAAKLKYIEDLLAGDEGKTYLHFLFINDQDSNWKQDSFIRFIPQVNRELWSQGKITLKHSLMNSLDSIQGRFAIVAPPVVKRILSKSSEGKNQLTIPLLSSSVGPNSGGISLPPIPQKSPYSVQNASPTVLPPH